MWYVLEYGPETDVLPFGVTPFFDEERGRLAAQKSRFDLPVDYTVYLVGPIEVDGVDILHLDNPNLIHRIENCGAV